MIPLSNFPPGFCKHFPPERLAEPMPFEIVRNDIVNMKVDAIVNTASPLPGIGYGVDAAIHAKAGPELLEARKAIGAIPVGGAAITPGFALDARWVIHAVGPVWQGGSHGEEALLRSCYDTALHLAEKAGCESVAFPLLCAGNHGFPKALALQTAVSAFSSFLMDHDMYISLVVFGGESLALSEKLFRSVQQYIDDTYTQDKKLEEYGISDKRSIREAELEQTLRAQRRMRRLREDTCAYAAPASAPRQPLEELLRKTDAGFSETLLQLIDRSGKTDAEVYKRANVDRKLFSKIRNHPDYRPSKPTALAFALALELDLEETKDLIGRAGYALSHSSRFDIIVEYFILEKNYDLFELNQVLFQFDQPMIGV